MGGEERNEGEVRVVDSGMSSPDSTRRRAVCETEDREEWCCVIHCHVRYDRYNGTECVIDCKKE